MREAVKRNTTARQNHLAPPIVAVAHPATVATSKDGLLALLVIALVFVVFSSTAGVEAAAAADLVGFVWTVDGHCVPVHCRKRRVLNKKCGRKERLRRLRHMREVFVARLSLHHATEILRHGIEHAVTIGHLLLLTIPTTFLLRLFFEQGAYADATSFRSEMATKCICTSEPPTATPMTVVLEVTAAHKLLLARMKAFVSFSIVLASECFTANAAHKWTLISVSAQMRTQIIGACETLRTQGALESCRMFLRTLWVRAVGRVGRSRGVGKIQNIVAVGDA